VIDPHKHCRRPIPAMLLLLAAAAATGIVLGGSVVLGLCSVVFMIRR